MHAADIMTMNPEQFEAVLTKVLNQNRAINEQQHREDHEFTAMLRERYKKREVMWEKFRLSIIGGIATGFVAGLVWIGKLVWEAIHKTP